MQRARDIIEAATKHKVTIATAESCTGGKVAAALTAIPGASAVFQSGLITYSNESKQELLSVPKAMLAKHGAVSEEVARAMAEAMRMKAKTTFAISVTGIAGPGGGSPEKPVGTVYIALAGEDHSVCRHHVFSGTRREIRLKALQKALDLLYEPLALLSS
jgi:PncC family amidohydrolase